MATQNLGRVGLVLKGEWDSATAYTALDVVSHDGNAWAAKQNSTNVEPTTGNSDFWQLFSNNADLVATVQGYKEDAASSATAAAVSAQKAEEESELGANAMQGIAPVFGPAEAYSAGDSVWYRGILYRFTADHSAGEWIGTDAEETKIAVEIKTLNEIIGVLTPEIFITKNAYMQNHEETENTARKIRIDNGIITFTTKGTYNRGFYIGKDGWEFMSGAMSEVPAPTINILIPIENLHGANVFKVLPFGDNPRFTGEKCQLGLYNVDNEQNITLVRYIGESGITELKAFQIDTAGATHYCLIVHDTNANKNEIKFLVEFTCSIPDTSALALALSN